MKKITFILLMLMLSSCASTSARKSITYSGLAGCAAGGAGGYAFSPEGRRNKRGNTALFCAVGASIAAITGYFLHRDDPSNRQLSRSKDIESVRPERKATYSVDGGRTHFNVTPNFSPVEVLEVSEKDIPESLRSRLPRQRVIVQEVKEQRIKQGGEYILIEPHRAYIYTTEFDE